MPIRIATKTLILFRNGERLRIKAGTKVNLTDAEYAEISAVHKDALSKPLEAAETGSVTLPSSTTAGADTTAATAAKVTKATGKAATADEDL